MEIEVAEGDGYEDVLNIALFSNDEPRDLHLATIDKAMFEKLQSSQNLKIDHFSTFATHL